MQAAIKKHVAYDLSRFDNRSIVREQVSKSKTRGEAKTRKRAVVSGFAVFCYLLFLGLTILTLYSYVALTETAHTAASLRDKLMAAREETQMLEIRKNQKIGSDKIKEYAENNLGMKKICKAQITYICMEPGDKTEIIRGEGYERDNSGIVAGIAYGMSKLLEYIN
jgi:cell division protein FtsB